MCRVVFLTKVWMICTKKYGILYFDDLGDALSGAAKLRHLNETPKIEKNPKPEKIYAGKE